MREQHKRNPLMQKDLGLTSCALCMARGPLRESHVIPQFVFDWLKETSGTGFIRMAETPNLRSQDGWKPRMLCGSCEQLFSTWEKAFAEQVFAPLNAQEASAVVRFQYGPWMLKFAVSVSWRVLLLFKQIGGLDEFPNSFKSSADRALRTWSEFLLGKRPHPGAFEQHMIPVDIMESTNVPNMPPNINRYMARAIDIYVAHSNVSCFTYAKMGKIVLFGRIAAPRSPTWHGTKLSVQQGVLGADTYGMPENILNFIIGQAEKMMAANQRLSQRQNQKIDEAFNQSIDRVAQSDAFRAMQQDIAMFGRSAFTRDELDED